MEMKIKLDVINTERERIYFSIKEQLEKNKENYSDNNKILKLISKTIFNDYE